MRPTRARLSSCMCRTLRRDLHVHTTARTVRRPCTRSAWPRRTGATSTSRSATTRRRFGSSPAWTRRACVGRGRRSPRQTSRGAVPDPPRQRVRHPPRWLPRPPRRRPGRLDWLQISLHAGQRARARGADRARARGMHIPPRGALSHPKDRILNHRPEKHSTSSGSSSALDGRAEMNRPARPARSLPEHAREALAAGVTLVCSTNARLCPGPRQHQALDCMTARRAGAPVGLRAGRGHARRAAALAAANAYRPAVRAGLVHLVPVRVAGAPRDAGSVCQRRRRGGGGRGRSRPGRAAPRAIPASASAGSCARRRCSA